MKRIAAWVGLVIAAVVLLPGLTAADSASIAGTVGDPTVDPDASNGGFFLRYVGHPAPDGYSHSYQWAGLRIVTASPESGPVTLTGTLDLSDRQTGDVSMIGLLDVESLEAGATSFQRGAYIYIFVQNTGNVRVGVTDGNAGGEIVQAFITIPATDVPESLEVVFTVDGTADPAGCATAIADIATSDGCMTLEIDGFSTLSDSYGTIVDPAGNAQEFATGGVPGWEAFPSGETGIDYSLLVEPTVLTKEICMGGGWEENGFLNLGQCIRFVNTGVDSR
jgi:hypothetical protein